jgi:hypothetical protein
MDHVGRRQLEVKGYVEVVYDLPYTFKKKLLHRDRPKNEETYDYSNHVRLDEECDARRFPRIQ